MSSEFSQEFQELANDFEKLLTTEEGYDVIIYAGENENIKELHAHSVILRTRSQYFHTAFSNEWAGKKKDGKFIFKKPNIPPQLFKIILRFIYCGKIDLTKLQGPEILKLLIAADELNVQRLILRIQEYLIKYQDKFLEQKPIEILEVIYQHELFTDLWNHCLGKICEEPEEFFNSDKFINLKAPLLELLLKRDDLNLDEIVIWNSLLKWGVAQNPSISQDNKKWSKEEITVMERTLHRFIPLIRFYHISSEDFVDKVYPLKKLLPKDLFNDLTIFNIAPNKKPNVGVIQPPRQLKSKSVLIESKHFTIFANWIDKKGDLYYDAKNIPYKFDLLFRASRDGNNTFHTKCDKKGATIVIAKVNNSEQIVGGYNPLYWDSSDVWLSTNDSFIFSFTNRNNIQSAKVSYSNGNQYSIACYSCHGPFFGYGSELYCISNADNHKWRNYGSATSYSRIDGMPRGNFDVDDFEVFQVIKK